MRLWGGQALAASLVWAVAITGCAGESDTAVVTGESDTAVVTGQTVPAQGEPTALPESGPALQVWTWEQVGCAEPAPAVPDAPGQALATDAGLAAGSVADETGVDLAEATRQMLLQDQLRGLNDLVRAGDGARIADQRWITGTDYAMQITLAGPEPPSESTQDLLCEYRELRVRVGAWHTISEQLGEAQRLGAMLAAEDMYRGVLSYGPQEFELVFDVADAETEVWLTAWLTDNATLPWRVDSLALPPLVIAPDIAFPLLDITGHAMPDAGIGGVLAIEGPCAYVGKALMIMPARETTWDPDTQTLDMGQGPMRPGDQIFGGGSAFFGSLDDLDQPVDQACRTDEVVLAVFGPAG